MQYREVDVSVDAGGAAEMQRLTGQRGVPVTVIDGQAVVGFDVARLEALLASQRRPRLGAAIADAAAMAAQGRTAEKQGAYVGRVASGGAAEAAGLAAGDVIVSVAGKPIHGAADLQGVLPRLPPGRDIPIAYVRDGRERTASLRL